MVLTIWLGYFEVRGDLKHERSMFVLMSVKSVGFALSRRRQQILKHQDGKSAANKLLVAGDGGINIGEAPEEVGSEKGSKSNDSLPMGEDVGGAVVSLGVLIMVRHT